MTEMYSSEFPIPSYSGYSFLEHEKWGKYQIPVVSPALLSYGDYDNSCAVERSNVRVFVQEFAELEGIEWSSVRGGWNSHSIIIRTDENHIPMDEDIREFLAVLENYPCADEDDFFALEYEMKREYLEENDRYILQDLGYRGILESIPEFDISAFVSENSHTLMDYMEIEAGGSVYLGTDRMKKEGALDTEMEKAILDFLPSGSGFDTSYSFFFTDTLGHYCTSSYHVMDDYGYYSHWIDFRVIFDGEPTIDIFSEDEDETHAEYIEEIIYQSLQSPSLTQQLKEMKEKQLHLPGMEG